jgi:2'-5' RNA ligase
MHHPAKHSMYYVAIVCHAEVNEKVLQFKYWMKEQFGCVVALKSPAHITLIPPFWLEEKRETDLLQTLQLFSTSLDQFDIHLQGFSHFGNRVLFIPVKKNPALDEIKKQTEKHFISLLGDCIKTDDRPFHPHVTIANRDMKPSDFIRAWEHFSKKEFTETFRSGTISLLKLGPDRWNVIGRKDW